MIYHDRRESKSTIALDTKESKKLIISKKGSYGTDQKIEDDQENDLVFATQKPLALHNKKTEQKYTRSCYVIVEYIVHCKLFLSQNRLSV